MKLIDLLTEENAYEISGSQDAEITGIVSSTADVIPGCCFVCIKGFSVDGHTFAGKAVEGGAAAVVMQDRDLFERFCDENSEAVREGRLSAVFSRKGTRHALGMLSDRFWGHPSGRLRLVGVTGTKGKTTTSIMLKSILDRQGEKTGLVGTMYNMIGERVIPTERTTPEANVLEPLLAEMADEGVASCVMEVSSQGLKLERVGGCEYELGIFTNLSRDHIGTTEHPDMEDYADSKAKLFGMAKAGLLNRDSEWYPRIKASAKCRLYTFSAKEPCTEEPCAKDAGEPCPEGPENPEGPADFRARNIVYRKDGVDFDLTGLCPTMHISTRIPGQFSIYNAMAAASAAYLLGCGEDAIVGALADVVVKGKAEVVPTGTDFTVMIDYAHNPDSFINILGAVKPFAKRTVFLFGAGGDRNRPRELMGETAANNADLTIITSDNPRTEDPARIVADIEKGALRTGKPYVCIVDRREAIWYSILNARPGDVIILAGKGHETEQIFKDRTVHFDEREVVAEAMAEYRRRHGL